MAAVSRYKLETLSTDQFEPREKFVDIVGIVGIQIDSNGNVTGWAANDRRKLGFYWPVGSKPIEKLVYVTSSYKADCEPRGMDDQGRVFLYCKGPVRHVIFTPASGKYQELSLTLDQLFEFRGAGGDSWGVGYSASHRCLTGARIGPDLKSSPQSLLPAVGDRSSIAVAVNSKGVAAGASSFLSAGGFVGEDVSNRLGRAAIWMPDKQEAELIPAPAKVSWVPQIGRAINEQRTVVGSTSPIAPDPPNACYQPSPVTDMTSTRAFVSTPFLTTTRWRTEKLPPVKGDATLTTLTATGINCHDQVIGVRDGVDCGNNVLLSGSRAILWERQRGKWIASAESRRRACVAGVRREVCLGGRPGDAGEHPAFGARARAGVRRHPADP